MANSHQHDRIHPADHAVLWLPESDRNHDPWTGAANQQERGLSDDTPIDEDVSLRPAEGKTPAEVEASLSDPPSWRELLEARFERDGDDRLQFSLRELLVLMTMTCLGLAAVQWLPATPLALALGVAALVSMWLAHRYDIRSRAFHLVTWALTAAYVATFVSAVWQTWRDM